MSGDIVAFPAYNVLIPIFQYRMKKIECTNVYFFTMR